MPSERTGPVWAVVVAGGSGARFGRPKQFADLAGRPVLAWAVRSARAVAEGVVLVLPSDQVDDWTGRPHGADRLVAGGPSRSASVRHGLAAVPEEAAIVVVHDAARPLAGPALFSAVLDALDDGRTGAAVCAVPVADTLKRVDPTGRTVVGTVDREPLVAVQTPQAFRADVLRRAHAGGGEATDDAALVEALGATVRIVAGDPLNLKLTTPADLAYAEYLLTPTLPTGPTAAEEAG
ncbi:MAG TPA: 2-C-methyl-D-erythritol 4-phosphate cytidylyltransferase [Acidimicrobiales bacterium]|jgi:2-C-methyl-D-erythritol 4-phosphate cytidylyltransferase|nr:2-C-methyl-D-erythritol 4-phosphate cytidylyltransferase [Acidimicrobiales bacterium]